MKSTLRASRFPPGVVLLLPLNLLVLAAGCSTPLPPSGADAARSRGAGVEEQGAPAPPAGDATASPSRPADPWLDESRVLARVNGEVIPLRRIRYAMGPAYEQFLPFREELAAKVNAELRKVILRRVVVQEALRLGLEATEEMMEEEEKRIREVARKKDSTLEQSWRDQGITGREWRDELRDSLTEFRALMFFTGQFHPSAYREEIFRPSVDLFVAPEEIRAWGEANRPEVEKPASATLRMIDLRDDSFRGDGVGDGEAREQCAAAAEDARRRALAGESFADLARTLSQGSDAAEGGLLGPILPDGPQRREFREWAFAPGRLPGEVSEPIRMPAGFVLLYLEARQDGRAVPIGEWGPVARDRIERVKMNLAWNEVCRHFLESASLEPEALKRSILADLAVEGRALRAALPRPAAGARTSQAPDR